MTRQEALAKIAAVLPRLSDERVQVLAEIADEWVDDGSRPIEDQATRTAIANGLAQSRRGEFATDAEIAEAFARLPTSFASTILQPRTMSNRQSDER